MSPIALLGGLGTTTTIWRAQLQATPDALAFDLPGHGAEPPAGGSVSIEAFGISLLDRLPERFSFCGVSMGGMVGLWIAANAPGRVERLVVACSGAKLGRREDYEARAALVRSEGVGAVVEAARDRWFTPSFRESPEARIVLDELAAMSPEGYAACCEAVGAADLRGDLPRIPVPVAVIFGEEDAVTPPDVRDELVSGLHDVRTVRIAGAAHLACVEQPEAFTAAVLDHLRSAA